ncbi:hypothetical protein NDU88_001496 [Pleurodeles waltl]|nr:hypothetical protein NDU88_001496 [Pleurodeles waltl]
MRPRYRKSEARRLRNCLSSTSAQLPLPSDARAQCKHTVREALCASIATNCAPRHPAAPPEPPRAAVLALAQQGPLSITPASGVQAGGATSGAF